MQRMRDQTSGEPLIIMGMIECSLVITQTWPDDDLDTRLQTAGTPLPHTEIRIIDAGSGAVVPFATAGDLCIRSCLSMAGGMEMLLGTDIRLTVRHASVVLPEAARGVTPFAGALVRLPRQMPYALALAMEMLLTGAAIHAENALKAGLSAGLFLATA